MTLLFFRPDGVTLVLLSSYQGILSHEAEIKSVEVAADDLFFLIACDGVWDVLTDQEAIDIAAKYLGNPEVCTAIGSTTSRQLDIVL